MIGTTISHYRILEKLGEGGRGIVYRAHDTKLDRPVALKFISSSLTVSEQDKTRFIHEARAASALEHSNICAVYEIDETPGGQMFLVMPAYEGIPLNKKVEHGPLPINEAIDIAIQIAEGLQAAHEKGIVHRDIKSSNIFITSKGQVKIMDFGLARSAGMTKVTKTGTTIGTVPFMSPEQARGEKVDHRTDIWSLGVILYEMVAGRMPFRSDYSEAIVYSILKEEPEPLTSLRSNVPMELERIVNKAMEKDRNMRYQHAGDLLTDLRRTKREIESGVRVEVEKKRAIQYKKPLYVFGSIIVVAILINVAVLYLIPTKTDVIDSIAVLPLKNLSGDPAQEYFVAGMHEAMITELSKIGALRVISRTSTLQYRETDKPMKQIARELGVDAVVEGSAMLVGDRVRITAQLINARLDRHIWADSYDRSLADVLTLQGEVALTIAEQIKVKLTPEEAAQLEKARPVNPDAYKHYLIGIYHLYKMNEAGFYQAINSFQDAINIDPGYAHAYAGIGFTYVQLGLWFGFLSPMEVYPKARQAVDRALDLDPNLPEAHILTAEIKYIFEWDWEGAEAAFRRGMELNPNSAFAYNLYGCYLHHMGYFKESIVSNRKAKDLDPLSPPSYGNIALAFFQLGRYEEMLDELREGLKLAPNYPFLYIVMNWYFLQHQKCKEVLHNTDRIARLWGEKIPPLQVGFLGYSYAMCGRHDEAIRLLNELHTRSQTEYVPYIALSDIYLGLGQPEEAIDYLLLAYEQREVRMVQLKTRENYFYTPISDNPRFRDLMRRMNFPE
jgi:eukaryotic-like serine/threonine-protein kinase